MALHAKANTSQGLRRNLLRGMSVGLCAAMAASVGACSNFGGSGKARETISSDEPYFSSKELDFYKAGENEDSYVMSMTPCGDKIAIILNVTHYDQTILKDGTIAAEGVAVAETAAAETAAKETVKETDATESTEATAGEDTAASDETETTSDPIDTGYSSKYLLLLYDKDGKLTSQNEIGSDILGDNANILSVNAKPDGNLAMLVAKYDPTTYAQENFIYTVDESGKKIGDPTSFTFEDNFYPSSMLIDDQGYIYLSGYADKAEVIVLDDAGKTVFKESGDSLSGQMYRIDGKVYIDSYDAADNYKYKLFAIDVANKKLGDAIDASSIQGGNGGQFFSGSDGLYMNSSDGVYKVDLEKAEKSELVLWKDCDFFQDTSGSNQVAVLSDSKLIVITTSYSMTDGTSETKAILLSKEDKNPNAGKTVITIGGISLSYDSALQKQLYNFNKASSDYRIEIKDYSAGVDYSTATTPEDYNKIYSDMIKKMNLDIVSGEGPDILYGNYGSYDLYEAKGLLVDMNDLIAKDKDFKKDDFLSSMFTVCETDGHLYKIGTSFNITGLVGASSIIGDRTGWTFDEFDQVAQSLPTDMAPIAQSNYTQSNLLQSILGTSIDEFIDQKNGKADFDSDSFRKIMNFCKTYGRDDDIVDDGSNYVDEQELIRNKELALMSCYISDPSGYHQLLSVFGEPVSIVGYPSADKRGPSCNINSIFAISSSSADVDTCWSFIKSFFTEEAQDDVLNNWMIPVRKSSFEKQIDKALHPDENNGNVVYYYNGDGTNTPMTEEEADAYRTLVNSLTTMTVADPEIQAIIDEEVPAFFNDQKTDSAVSALIQNRVETLIKERA